MPFFRPSNAFLNWHLPESGLPPVTLRMRPPSWGLTLRAVFLMVKRNTRKEHIHRMRTAALHFTVAMLLIAGRAPAQSPDTPAASTVTQPSATASPAVQQLLSFQPSEVKFPLHDLMDVLSDRRHEGWVLAAYPDPKTRQPLIGAGFSLDLPAREHPQRDQLNPHSFLEPSSADLWQAAGLQPARLQNILVDFQQHSASWTRKNRRAKINSLAPQISDEDANLLLRIASIQAIENARAYCRNFDRLSASQQMALSQLVYQMGVNLEEFTQFLSLVNSPTAFTADASETGPETRQSLDWKAVQQSLIQSQWARVYRTRAVAVIAMLDPRYADNPSVAERRIGATLRPAVVRHRGRRPVATPQLASASHHHTIPAHAKSLAHRKHRA